jgi:hypothetical protein
MKSSRFLLLPFWAAVLYLTSCSGNEEKKASDTTTVTTSDTMTTTTAGTTAPAAADTTPVAMMVARHKVKNYTDWKASYDAHDSLRQANGIHSYAIGRGLQDSNTVLVAVTVDDMAKAKAFAKDASLKKAMQKGGVTGTPTFRFLTMTYRNQVTVPTELRSMTTFSVKDWNAWKTNFEDGRQQRLDNGLTDRAYGHDADDNNKVVLVVAVNDTAKARAYWNSDQLKQRRMQGGVIDTPERFVYQVVQRYQ